MEFTVADAQADMRQGYCSGAPGILTSGLAWSVAACLALFASAAVAINALLLGGMLIHPVAVLSCKLLGARGNHTKGNPFGLLAGASTCWLLFCLPLAYLLGLQKVSWFFLAMLLIIGGRYLVFATLYGMRLYWGLGIALAAAAFGMGILAVPPAVSVLVGAALEIAFGAFCLVLHRRWFRANPAAAAAPLRATP